MKRVCVQSFGCRASQADGAGIESSLRHHGMEAVANASDADLIVLNTCTVTANADSDARQAVRRIRRENPDARIAITGCYAQRAPDELAALDGVTWVIGNSEKEKIADIVLEVKNDSIDYHGQIRTSDISQVRTFAAAPVVDAYSDRTRPTLKVQDGCGNKCSFCIIPSVRGRSRSASLASIIEQVRDLGSRYAEIVLSGINLGRWGRDLSGERRFPDLLRSILKETAARRVRISSVEPMDWSGELIQLMADEPRIARHVHIPLQSGSDGVLKRMFRKYRVRHYESRLDAVQRLMPDAAIAADVMTGFPGETEQEFRETLDFIEGRPFTYLHVFTYSERPGTAAATHAGQVPVDVRRERTRILRALSSRKNAAFRERMMGVQLSCVTLGGVKALSTNYLPVELSQARPENQIVSIRVEGLSELGLREAAAFRVLSNV